MQYIQQQLRSRNIDIECGYRHNIVLDRNGDNQSYQSGLDSNKKDMYTSTKIKLFNRFIVDKIKVGWRHNWIKTKQVMNDHVVANELTIIPIMGIKYM